MASDVAEPRYGEKAQDAGQHFKPFVDRSLNEQPMTTLASHAANTEARGRSRSSSKIERCNALGNYLVAAIGCEGKRAAASASWVLQTVMWNGLSTCR
jgi:hypothetical protein